jgi:uncharacterized protein YaaN involved in tellurite resistance
MENIIQTETASRNGVAPSVAAAALASPADKAQEAERQPAAKLPAIDAKERLQLAELPELQSLKVGRSLMDRLKPERRQVAQDYADRQNLEDQMEIAKIGSAQQEDSRKVMKMTGKLLKDDAKVIELGEVGKLAEELKTKMVELGVGDLEERWYHKAIRAVPIVGGKVDRLGTFIARYDRITTRLEEILKAMTDEKAEIEELYFKAGKIVKVNQQALENLTVAAAAVELMLKKKEEEYKATAAKYEKQGALEDEDLEQLTLMRNTLSALDRKLVTLKIQRVETRTSIRMMRDLMDAAFEARAMLEDQITLQESIWRNQINNAILEHKIRGVNGMIRNSRDFTNRLIAQNKQNVSDTIRELKQMAGEPGVDLAVLKGAIESQKALHEAMLEASVQNRKKMTAAAAALDEIDQQIGEDGKDLPTLQRMLEEDDADLPELKGVI